MRYFVLILALLLTGCQQEFGQEARLSLADKYQSAEIKNKYDLKSGVLERKGRGVNDVKAVIGEKTQERFGAESKLQPNIELTKWDETRFKLISKDTTAEEYFDKDKVLIDGENLSYEIYETEDEMKYIWYLREKPKSNTLAFDIETEGLNFYYQPPLDEEGEKNCTPTACYEEINGQMATTTYRPIDVVGSYAVYHETKGGLDKTGAEKQYKTGKAFHIYRPHIIDANGKDAWADLHIDKKAGTYTVTIPQEFLDKAVYPIKSNDTFGYETAGSSGDQNIYDGRITFDNADGADGTGDNITAYVRCDSGGSGGNLQYHLYDNNQDKVTNGITNENTSVENTSYEWISLDFSSSPDLTSQTYYLSAWSDVSGGPGGNLYIAYDDETGNDYWHDNSISAYNSWPDQLTKDSTLSDRRLSIYATYTASGNETDSCTYDSGNWNILYSDNCHISGTTYVDGDLNVNYDGAGSLGLDGTIQCDNFNLGSGASIDMAQGAKIEIY
jgi:hypothetical protein